MIIDQTYPEAKAKMDKVEPGWGNLFNDVLFAAGTDKVEGFAQANQDAIYQYITEWKAK